MKIIDRIKNIGQKIKKAKLENREPFGSEEHNWKMQTKIDKKELQTIESLYSIILPQEYRSFLLTLGNGGAGPAYGMYSLQSGIAHLRKPTERDCLVTEFRHLDYYNPFEDPSLRLSLEKLLDNGKITNEYNQMLERTTYGTLVVGHEGCGYMHRLVITGPRRGTVWIDSSCSDQGYIPLNVSFLDWYELWIDDVLLGNDGTWWLQLTNC